MATAQDQLQTPDRSAPIYSWPANPKHKLDEFGIEPPLDDVQREFQQTLRKFAVEVMRPIGQKLDRMTAEEIIAKDSPFWDFHKQFNDLGISLGMLAEMEPKDRSEMFCILFEELGYGDGGLAISVAAGMLPQYLSMIFQNEFLMDRFPEEMLGCWAITEPDHGSDTLDPQGMIRHPDSKYGRPGTTVKFKGDKMIINGQKSAWVSNGTCADVCILYAAADTGDGADYEKGCVLVIPMDLPGISRGKPLEKLGQRGDPQGEVFFNDVEVGMEYLLAGPEDFQRAVYCIHAEANALMGAIWNGAARSAYHMAHDYAHERKQGGVPIYKHQLVAYRLFDMFRRIEASAALTRRVVHYNQAADVPALQAAMTAKVTATDLSFQIASDAIQIFGGNGLTHEYPLEKIMRDCRASMIEDGENHVLSLKGGYYLMDPDKL
ncbi:MAG: acyl-CoA dehydrogenase [Salinisphaeraceae bacterium]|nr:acyl-CoA dehydrogenase [Salinisphaeraceae bacterium]